MSTTTTTSPSLEARRATLVAYLRALPMDVEESTYYENGFEHEGTEYLVLTYDEATEIAGVYIEETLWAFRPEFLEDYVPWGIGSDDLRAMIGDRCEDANDALVALVKAGRGMDDLIRDAASADGIEHFMRADHLDEQYIEGETVILFEVH